MSVFHPFMILKGVPTHFEDPQAGVEYAMPSYRHLTSTYVHALHVAGFRLEEMHEPLVDDAVVQRFPNMARHRDVPLALILRATPRW
jgi:hypothetical protein